MKNKITYDPYLIHFSPKIGGASRLVKYVVGQAFRGYKISDAPIFDFIFQAVPPEKCHVEIDQFDPIFFVYQYIAGVQVTVQHFPAMQAGHTIEYLREQLDPGGGWQVGITGHEGE